MSCKDTRITRSRISVAGQGCYTGNTMGMLAEAMGLSLPHSATLTAATPWQLRAAKNAGMQFVRLIEQDVRASAIMTR